MTTKTIVAITGVLLIVVAWVVSDVIATHQRELWMAQCAHYQVLNPLINDVEGDPASLLIGLVRMNPPRTIPEVRWFPQRGEYFYGFRVSRAGRVAHLFCDEYHGSGAALHGGSIVVDTTRLEALWKQLPKGCSRLPRDDSRLLVCRWLGKDNDDYVAHLYDLRHIPRELAALIQLTDHCDNWQIRLAAYGMAPTTAEWWVKNP